MLNKLNAFKEVITLVRFTNQKARERGSKVRVGFLLTNRSFLVPAITMIVNILVMLNMESLTPLLDFLKGYEPEYVATQIIAVTTGISFMWAIVERAMTTARAVVTPHQAEKALAEVVGDDQLAKSLRKAITS